MRRTPLVIVSTSYLCIPSLQILHQYQYQYQHRGTSANTSVITHQCKHPSSYVCIPTPSKTELCTVSSVLRVHVHGSRNLNRSWCSKHGRPTYIRHQSQIHRYSTEALANIWELFSYQRHANPHIPTPVSRSKGTEKSAWGGH